MLETISEKSEETAEGLVDARVVFLTHYIPLYQVRVLQAIAARVRDFHVLLSTPIEPNRNFAPDWSGLNVTVQDTWTIRQRWRHRSKDAATRFDDALYVHFPYDTSRRLRELKPDVVMSLELGARSLGVIRYCRKHPETKSVLCTYMSEHTEQNRGRLRRRLRKYLLHHADALTYNGPSCLRYLETYGIDQEKMHHFPYAADDRSSYDGPLTRDEQSVRNRFLCVGQLSERKGVRLMLQQVTAYCIQQPDKHLQITFAGDGPMRAELEAYAVPDNLTLRFMGNVTPDDLSIEMLRHGALIAPTLADEWLLVVNEGMQAGLPVLGSVFAQAVTTLVDDGRNGWQYCPSEPGSLACALNRYFEQSIDQIKAMRENARASVAHLTPQWAATGAVDAITSVLDKGGSSSGLKPTTSRVAK